jgi:hypothetical protein
MTLFHILRAVANLTCFLSPLISLEFGLIGGKISPTSIQNLILFFYLNHKVEDLRAHIQRYVNEVKRIEELLALREKERMELLDQVFQF